MVAICKKLKKEKGKILVRFRLYDRTEWSNKWEQYIQSKDLYHTVSTDMPAVGVEMSHLPHGWM